MALRGGYKIIDLKDKPLTVGVGMVYEGIYESIEETRKPILLSGLVGVVSGVGPIEFNDVFVIFMIVGSNYETIVTTPTLTGAQNAKLTISDNDVVTFTLLS